MTVQLYNIFEKSGLSPMLGGNVGIPFSDSTEMESLPAFYLTVAVFFEKRNC